MSLTLERDDEKALRLCTELGTADNGEGVVQSLRMAGGTIYAIVTGPGMVGPDEDGNVRTAWRITLEDIRREALRLHVEEIEGQGTAGAGQDYEERQL